MKRCMPSVLIKQRVSAIILWVWSFWTVVGNKKERILAIFYMGYFVFLLWCTHWNVLNSRSQNADHKVDTLAANNCCPFLIKSLSSSFYNKKLEILVSRNILIPAEQKGLNFWQAFSHLERPWGLGILPSSGYGRSLPEVN